MTLPANQSGTRPTVWLTGDPSFLHEELACLFSRKLAKFRDDQSGQVDATTLDRLNHGLINTVECIGSPRVTVTAVHDGYVKARCFVQGPAIKEPDATFHTSSEIPLRHAQHLGAVEVAFANEDMQGILFEALLWTQRGSKQTNSTSQRALNFAGIYVGRGERDVYAHGFKYAFAVLKIPHNLSSNSEEIYLLNASSEYEMKWQQAIADSGVEGISSLTSKKLLLPTLSSVRCSYKSQSSLICLSQSRCRTWSGGCSLQSVWKTMTQGKCRRWQRWIYDTFSVCRTDNTKQGVQFRVDINIVSMSVTKRERKQ